MEDKTAIPRETPPTLAVLSLAAQRKCKKPKTIDKSAPEVYNMHINRTFGQNRYRRFIELGGHMAPTL